MFVGTKNFSVDEFNPKGYNMSDAIKVNAQHTLERLQDFRDHLNMPIIIKQTSSTNGGFAIDGHGTESAHYIGCAVDINVKGMTSKELGLKALEFFEPIFYEKLISSKSVNKFDMVECGLGLDGSTILHIDFMKFAQENWFSNYGSYRPNFWLYGYSDNIYDWYKNN